MNSDVEPNPRPPPASSSPDEVASSLDKISISSNNNMIHPTNEEDTPMIEASSYNNNAETLSPEDFINKLHSQKAAMLKIIDSINDQNIQFVMQNNFEGLESNDKKLSFATKSLERFDKLIADQVNITVGQKIAARNCKIPVLQLVVYGYCTKLSQTLIVCTSLERAFIRRLSDMDNGYWRNLI